MSALARCLRWIQDAPPHKCWGFLQLRFAHSPTERAASFVVIACDECGAIHEAAAVSAYDDSRIQAEGGL